MPFTGITIVINKLPTLPLAIPASNAASSPSSPTNHAGFVACTVVPHCEGTALRGAKQPSHCLCGFQG